jgi:hypothetical protein
MLGTLRIASIFKHYSVFFARARVVFARLAAHLIRSLNAVFAFKHYSTPPRTLTSSRIKAKTLFIVRGFVACFSHARMLILGHNV